MFRPKRRWKKQRDKWHMRLLRRLYLNRKFCSLCERYRDDNPEPREIEQFVHRSAAALVYETRRFRKRQFIIRVGRWQGMSKGLVLTDYLEPDDLDDVRYVVRLAHRYIEMESSVHKTAH